MHCGADIDGLAFCTRCGTAAGQVARPVPGSSAGGAQTSAGFAAPTAVTEIPILPAAGPTEAAVRRMRRRRIGFAVTGLLVAAGVAGIAVTTLSDAPAGSATGSDAVTAFLTALAAEDALGVVDHVAPSDLTMVRSLVDEATEAAEGEGDAAEQAREQGIDIDPDDLIPGLEVQLDRLETDEVELADTVHRVDLVSLDVSWTFDPRALLDMFDIGELTDGQMTRDDLLEGMGDLDDADGSFDQDDLEIDGIDPFLMTVEEEGSWYVSPTYTVLEYIRQVQDLPAPDFTEPTSTGSATQAEAIERTIEAWGSGDVRRVIEALPPGSYPALHAYRDALAELVGNDGTGLDVDASVTLDDVTTFDDDRGTGVRIEQGTIEIEVDDGDGDTTGRLVIDGSCIEASTVAPDDVNDDASTDDASTDVVSTDESTICLDHFSDDPDVPFHDGIPGIDSFWLVMDEDRGGWFLDPFATTISWLDAVDMEAVQAELEEYLDQLGELTDQLGVVPFEV